MTKELSHPIAAILRAIGSAKCLAKAEALEKESSPANSLNLRDLDLSPTNAMAIVSCLSQETAPLKSISFSYNTTLGDEGAMALSEQLSNQISEIGLVNCGISDAGGTAMLHWMKNAPSLQMICIEQNDFSEKLKLEYRKFSSNNPQILVVL